jgi:hypothetical protein
MAEASSPGEEGAHDILAAEAFGFPAADPELHHHGPVVLPDDPTGIEEPHDVLAAEEFPMPAPPPAGLSAAFARRRESPLFSGLALLAVALLLFRAVRRG